MAFSSLELAFQADDEPIAIMPKQALASMEMSGWVSPHLRPLRRSEVPLWFAVVLKRQDRCTIIWPAWLEAAQLQKFVDSEKTNSHQFSSLPWYWQMTSEILVKEASDDCPSRIDEILQLLQELREIRLTKTRAGLLLANESHLQMTGLGALELNEVVPVLGETMRMLTRIDDASKNE